MLMMRQSRSERPRYKLREAQIPAPVGGWNARDSVTAMAPTDAIVLDNMIVSTEGVKLRKGYAEWATGIAGSYVESLLVYAPENGNDKMFAAGPAGIYDVTASGAVGAQVQGSLTNGRWSQTMFSTLGGNYMFIANGEDAIRHYDGSAWTQPTITGFASQTTAFITIHMQRLWMIPENALSVWYLPVGAIEGAAVELPLGVLVKRGGKLLAMASWTRDGGAGLDDMAAFLTSKGEVLLYSGIDPDDASTWAFAGQFEIPEPIGRRCVIKLGGDVGVITSTGVISLAGVLGLSSAGAQKASVTDKIARAYDEIYAISKAAHGWQVIESPVDQLVLVNIPKSERVEAYQYVMNTGSGAWSRWTGINANCWAYFDGDLYCGSSDGKVYKLSATKDLTAAINGVIVHAYQAFGAINTKVFDTANVIAFGPSGYIPSVSMRTNYDESLLAIAPIPYEGTGPSWDEVYWDEEYWADEQQPVLGWQAVAGEGVVGSLNVGISATEEVIYNGALVRFRVGGPM